MYDINSEKAVRKRRFYYHVTSIRNIDKIKKAGLKADKEGHIFAFTDQRITEDVAANQCFINKVALFVIDSRGITGKVIRDQVGELAAPFHRIIIQDKISKQYVKFLRSWTIDFDNPTPWQLYKIQKTEGVSKEEAKNRFYERRELAKFISKQFAPQMKKMYKKLASQMKKRSKNNK